MVTYDHGLEFLFKIFFGARLDGRRANIAPPLPLWSRVTAMSTRPSSVDGQR